jgi:hypothetical protein
VIAAESLDPPPSSGEAVINTQPGRETLRTPLRLSSHRARQSVVVGSFEIGHANGATVSLMPDDKHLFVSAEGAGYIIDVES